MVSSAISAGTVNPYFLQDARNLQIKQVHLVQEVGLRKDDS